MTEWEEDCLHHYGKVLTGKYGHFCVEFDGLPIDETCHEFLCCLCECDDWDTDEVDKAKDELHTEMLKN